MTLVPTNTFNLATGDLIATTYSDSTPPLILTNFNRLGLPERVIDSSGDYTFTYDAAGRALTESDANGYTTTIVYDSKYGLSSVSLGDQTETLLTHNYDYNATDGRLEKVSTGSYSANYEYLDDSDLLEDLIFKNGATTVLTTTRDYNYGYQLSLITNHLAGVGPVSSHSYIYDKLDRRTKATLEDASYWDYGYDSKSQLESAERAWSDSTPVAGQQFGFDYDNIGNRKSAPAGGDSGGGGLRKEFYTPNALNQYTKRTVTGSIDVVGVAATNATVTVNNLPTYRHGEYYRAELSFENFTNAIHTGITNIAVVNNHGAQGEDLVDTETGDRFIPQTPEEFEYDADGNTLFDGRWTYTWNAENRLIKLEAKAGLPAGARKKLEFTYDYQGRRRSKTVHGWTGTAWQLESDQDFYYNGWNLVATIDAQSTSLEQAYLWGTDLSGNMEDAGGVGGLFAVVAPDTTDVAHFTAYDGNGNIVALVDASNDSISAKYEYSPYGTIIRETGVYAPYNPFRFSTKYYDLDSGHIYYGYRYLDPKYGGWMNRDPILENGGLNLYGFVANNPINLNVSH